MGVRGVRARAPGNERAFAVALLAVALGWLVHSLVDWDWDIPAVTLVAMVALGLLAARPREATALAPPRVPAGRGPLLAVGAAATFALMASALLPAWSQHLTDDALAQANRGTAADLREAQETAALAKRLNPFAVEPVFAQAAIAERGNQAAAAAGLLVEAVERQPSNPSAWTRLGRFQVAVGDSRGALRSILIAASLDRRGLTAISLSFQAFVRPEPLRLRHRHPAARAAAGPGGTAGHRHARRHRSGRPAGAHAGPAGAHAGPHARARPTTRAALATARGGRGRAVPVGGLTGPSQPDAIDAAARLSQLRRGGML